VQQRGGDSRCSKEEGTAGAAKRREQQVQQRGGDSRCSKEEGTAGAAKRREQQGQGAVAQKQTESTTCQRHSRVQQPNNKQGQDTHGCWVCRAKGVVSMIEWVDQVAILLDRGLSEAPEPLRRQLALWSRATSSSLELSEAEPLLAI